MRIQINEKSIGQTEASLSRMQIFFCYFSAFVLILFTGSVIVLSFIQAYKAIIGKNLSFIMVFSVVSTVYFLFHMTKTAGNHWRSSEREISTPFMSLPNLFYDESYVKGDFILKSKIKDLNNKLSTAHHLLIQSNQLTEGLEESVVVYEEKLRVMLRHNDNSNRILKSFNFLMKREEKGINSVMLRNILAECITILEKDKSDKSISLFRINDNKLRIIESVRINAESTSMRSFVKGEGFAGFIWEDGKEQIINDILETDPRFNDQGIPKTPIGSIMGFPLIVDQQILGVLCIQSEIADGFSEADLRTVEFYVRMCTFILLRANI